MIYSKQAWAFILQWMAATMLALVLTFAATNFWLRGDLLITGFVIGPLLLGTGQAWLLRSHLRHSWQWAIATAIGCCLAIVAALSCALVVIEFANILDRVGFAGTLELAFSVALCGLSTAVAGLVIGIAQWLVLRRQVKRARRWLISSTLALFFGVSWLLVVGVGFYSPGTITTIGVLLLSGAIGGGIKGVSLWQLLQHRR